MVIKNLPKESGRWAKRFKKILATLRGTGAEVVSTDVAEDSVTVHYLY